jgi:hypothetical protein
MPWSRLGIVIISHARDIASASASSMTMTGYAVPQSSGDPLPDLRDTRGRYSKSLG